VVAGSAAGKAMLCALCAAHRGPAATHRKAKAIVFTHDTYQQQGKRRVKSVVEPLQCGTEVPA